MSRFTRFALFGIFAAVGVGVAISVALAPAGSRRTVRVSSQKDQRTDQSALVRKSTALKPPAAKPPATKPPVSSESSNPRQVERQAGRLASAVNVLPRSEPDAIAAASHLAGVEAAVPIAAAMLQQKNAEADSEERVLDKWMTLWKLVNRMQEKTQDPSSGSGTDSASPSQQPAAPSTASPSGTSETSQPESKPSPSAGREALRKKTRFVGLGEGDITATFAGEDLRGVLELLSEQSDTSILASKNVQGTVSATLKHVTFFEALDAILKSTGYVWRQEGNFIYVGTPQDFEQMQQAADHISTRLYRPNYVKASELQGLITPLLTPQVGSVSVTSPSQVGIEADSTTAEGDGFAGQEALLVRDYESVLVQVDQIVEQVDQRPTQVAIEAMILSVNLDDSNELGVDFEVLRNKDNIRLISGSPLGSLANIDVSDGGLKVGFLDSSLALFLDALESIGDTNVIATPRLMCLNKHPAEILIGEQLGYVSTTQTETSTTQSVEFLEVGTQLRIRPFISSDGLIRMEVHPELSTGNVRLVGEFTLPDKQVTQVTTNIMVRDGCTVVIGGLLRDELTSTASQIPLIGSLPVIGPVFRQNVEATRRQEILVLITPRIVYEPNTCCEGDQAGREFHHRHAVYADKMIPFSKRYIGRKYLRLAQEAWDAGNGPEALKLINLAVHFDPLNRAAIDLRADIWAGNPTGDHTKRPPPAMPEEALDGAGGAPWILDRLQAESHHPHDPGRPGSRHTITKPRTVP